MRTKEERRSIIVREGGQHVALQNIKLVKKNLRSGRFTTGEQGLKQPLSWLLGLSVPKPAFRSWLSHSLLQSATSDLFKGPCFGTDDPSSQDRDKYIPHIYSNLIACLQQCCAILLQYYVDGGIQRLNGSERAFSFTFSVACRENQRCLPPISSNG